MKKLYLGVLFCALSLAACNDDEGVYAVKIEDKTFREYLLRNFDTNGDSRFSKEEIEKVKTIDVSYLNIASINGIEIFNHIETLKCNNNNIGNIDLEENKQLLYLDCSFNRNDGDVWIPINSKIKYINSENGGVLVRINTDIEYLNCPNTKIKGILVNANKLKYLNCSNTGINSVDVSDSKDLEYLNVSNNTFNKEDYIDLSNQPNLKTFKAENTTFLKTIYLKEGQKIEEFNIDKYIDIVYK